VERTVDAGEGSNPITVLAQADLIRFYQDGDLVKIDSHQVDSFIRTLQELTK
jgi:hypothetical protein